MIPLFKNVLIKPDEAEKKTEGGIWRPETAAEKTQQGEVLAVGGEVKVVKKGQRVLYKKWGGDEVKEGLIVREEDLLAIV